jgi:hypothetical protein
MRMSGDRSVPGPRVLALAAPLIAVIVALAPTGAPAVRAAEDDGLRVAADATYRVVTSDGLVRVRIDFDMTNLRPNTVRQTPTGSVTTRWYFDRLDFAVPPEARSVRATSGGSRLGTTVDARTDFAAVTVRFPDLYYRASRTVRVDFTLPGGKPRSSSDIRVGSAFTTFTAWAWGDDGRSTVRIVLPRGFDDSGYGENIVQRTYGDRVELTSGTLAKPTEWYRVVVADRPSALTDLRIEPGGRSVVVQAWPEDRAWRDRVAEVLEGGLPALEELVGLEWPVDGDLEVSEVHTPLLHGYAGFYDERTDEITMSEDLDEHTILHEASHAWFNGDLIRDRWIDEGLAEYYAQRVRERLGITSASEPVETAPTAKGSFQLNDWPDPSRIDDAEEDAKELFGYSASYTVIRAIARDIGDEGMRAVLAAAEAGHNAYAGDGPPETTGARTDWRRFLDLVQEVGGSDRAETLFQEWVVPAADADLLRTRGAARDAYEQLDAAGDAWAVPIGIRANMALWRFAEATDLIDAAEPVVALRDDLAAASADLGLQTPADVEAPFEAAGLRADLAAVADTLESRIAAAGSVADARDALAVERTPLMTLGLAGETPDAGYVAARTALSGGDVAGATAGAAATLALLAGAEAAGTTRAVAIGLVAAVVLLLLVALAVVLRRRRRRMALLGEAAHASSTLAASPGPGDALPAVQSTPIETARGAEPD